MFRFFFESRNTMSKHENDAEKLEQKKGEQQE